VSAKTNKGGIVSIDFINTSDGWALLYGEGLISTTDGGRVWSAPREPVQGSVMTYSFTGPSNGWALTSKGVLLHTLNNMKTWLTVTTPAAGTSLCATPSGSLWLGVSDSGSVYSSSNGGLWKLSLSGTGVPAAVTFLRESSPVDFVLGYVRVAALQLGRERWQRGLRRRANAKRWQDLESRGIRRSKACGAGRFWWRVRNDREFRQYRKRPLLGFLATADRALLDRQR